VTPKPIVRADGVFETALGLVLVAGAAANWLGPADFPDPVGRPVILAFGLALLAVGALLWRLAGSIDLRTLAAANAATAAAAVAWRVAAAGFSTTGSVLAVATAAALAALAFAQEGARRPGGLARKERGAAG
jgi:hypothetical protein